VPDYDITPQNTIVRVNGHHNGANGVKYASNEGERQVPKGTMGRIAAATEIARAASADAAELESIESYKMTNPGATTAPPRPPSVYFAPQKSGPPTMKKSTNRSVSVTIGEYGGLQTRKEPTKFDFIGKPPTNGHNDRTDFDVTTQLKHELEKTLSRSNLKKRSDSMVSEKMMKVGKVRLIIEFSFRTTCSTKPNRLWPTAMAVWSTEMVAPTITRPSQY
jgi:hypothetical protein